MYQPHNLLWFIPCFVLCAVVAGMGGWFKKKGWLKLQAVSKFCTLGLIGCWLVPVAGRIYDDHRLRKELRDIPPNHMQHLCIIKQRIRREVVDASEVSELMSRIQSLKNIGAHHSHPTDPFEITFMYDGQEYLYTIGRDSERPNEYWVNADSREDDIGRIRSDDLGQIVQRLLGDKQ